MYILFGCTYISFCIWASSYLHLEVHGYIGEPVNFECSRACAAELWPRQIFTGSELYETMANPSVSIRGHGC